MDTVALLIENEAMTDEIARLRAENVWLSDWADAYQGLTNQYSAEIARITELNARLLKHDGDAEAVCNSYATENQQLSDEIERLRRELEKERAAHFEADDRRCHVQRERDEARAALSLAGPSRKPLPGETMDRALNEQQVDVKEG